jgi:hypothetical protein
MKYLLTIVLFCLAGIASATTYYIDYSAANDSANGLTTSTPWKRHPYMVGWTGSYSHSAGDRFIFKGGVTWSNSVFPISVTGAGSAGNVDYYGADTSWYSGGAWTQPIFNAGSNVISGSGIFVDFYAGGSGSSGYVQFDNIEMTGYKWTNSAALYIGYIGCGTAENLTFSRLYLHGWIHAGAAADDLIVIAGANYGTKNAGTVVSNCVITALPGHTDSGMAVKFLSCVVGCTITNMPNGILGVWADATITNNHIGWMTSSFSGTHENGIESLGGGGTWTIARNRVHDCVGITIFIGGFGGTYYFYDNLVYATGSTPPVTLETRSSPTGILRAYNNTLVSGDGDYYISGFHLSDGGLPWDAAYLTNNHAINGIGTLIETVVTTNQSGNNLVQDKAAAASGGFTAANLYAPTNSSVATVDAGAAITGSIYASDFLGVSRPQGAAWDIGAYEYQAGGGGSPAAGATATVGTLRIGP